ncbi:MAG: lamin tail domain-containing protein [Verrucomicrobiales bacterium]|nr:lamin tail domain-containing protein [Verrucomicrobiales bacterium]
MKMPCPYQGRRICGFPPTAAALLALLVGVFATAAHGQTPGLLREFYADIPGNSVSDLTSAPAFPDRPTSTQILTNLFETGPDEAENYGQRIRAYVIPPETGNYVFGISSDDQSALYLSTDSDPLHQRIIASVNSWTGFRDWFSEPSQQSSPIRLEAGRLYYIEALQKEGGGGDHLSVRWTLPSGAVEEPIPASAFLPFGTPLFPPEITRQPASITVAEGTPATFLVTVSNSDPIQYQWQRNGVAIPGATRSSLVLPRVSFNDQGARFRCTLVNPLGVVISEEAVLTVLPDRQPPTLDTVFNTSLTNVVVRFSEPIDVTTGTRPGNYTLSGGITVSGARPGSTDLEVVLGTSTLTPGSTYVLTVSGVADRAVQANIISPNSRIEFTALDLAPTGLGRPPTEGIVKPVLGGVDITATGRGFGGTNDQAHFSFQRRTGDFDLQVRLASMELGTIFAQAGLLARQSLDADSPFAASFATPSLAGSQFAWRSATGAVAQVQGSFPVNYPDTWLRLKRVGTNFTGYASYDGATWSRLGTTGIAVSNSLYVGVAVSSRSTNAQSAVHVAFRDLEDWAPVAAAGVLPYDVEPLGPSSRRTSLVISEIHFHPLESVDRASVEFIEIFNADSSPIDLSGFRLSGDIDYDFPPGTRLAAGRFLVVAQDPEALAAAYSGTTALGPWRGTLPRDAGTVRLRNQSGAVLLEVDYTDESPWPAAADGGGHSLVLWRPSYGEGDARAWGPSALRHGTPGRPEVIRADRLRPVVINEVLSHTDDPEADFIELYNHGTAAVDLSGCILTDDPGNARFRIPTGTAIAPGGHLAWDQHQLGFALSAAGETLYFLSPEADRVVDAIRFGPQFNGVSAGRFPDGNSTWANLAQPSPAAANPGLRTSDIVINEIQYHPPNDPLGEFVELYNRGTTPVNLNGWRFVDGIEFAFTNDFVVAPGSHVIVAADTAYLRAQYPDLPPSVIAGSYNGTLSNNGERIALAQPESLITTNAAGQTVIQRAWVVVSEVTYRDGGRWGRWSDGGGSSLELIDPRSDPRLASSWADSDASATSPWTDVDFSGVLELGQGQANELHLILLGSGECLIDDIQVLDGSGANLLANSTFEGGLTGWFPQGNHVQSTIATNGYNSRRSLHLKASGGGDNGANRIRATLTGGALFENSFATFRAKIRWLHGHPDLLLRLKGNYLETTAHLDVPTQLGTPGRLNSRTSANAGPSVAEVVHRPILPAALEPVIVTARLQDPDGVRSAKLKVRYDPSVSVTDIPMTDDGQGADALKGDGIFSARIPGQATGVIAAFRIEAVDFAARPATNIVPHPAAGGECLVRFGDEIPAGSFGTYRLWMTQANTDAWTAREYMSNEALDGTIVYGSTRVIYNGGARYRGSPFIRPNYDGPTGNLCAYVWTVPADDLLLGSDEFNLDWLEQPGRDPTLQRERISFWIGDQLGVPFSHQKYVRVFVNGIRRGEVYADSQQPNSDYIASWFPDADSGQIFKIDDWFEFSEFATMEFNINARLERYSNSLGQPHKTRYRWSWEKKSNRGLDDDYSDLLALVEAFNNADEAQYSRRISELVDLDGWLRSIATRRVVADWDGYGYSRGKNTFMYLPPGGRWRLLLWDLDFSLGGGSDGPSTDLYTAEDPTMERVYRHPLFGRVYLQAFQDAVRGPLAAGVVDPLLLANYEAFIGNGVTAASPTPIRSFIQNRRDYLNRVLASNTAPWTVQGPTNLSPALDQNVVTLTGTAPIELRSIAINGLAYEPQWQTRSNWSLQIPLRAGTNYLSLAGLDRRGQRIQGASGTLALVYSGEEERPEDFVRFTEIMYEPIDPDAEFVEIHNASTKTTFDLSGWHIDGLDLTLPGGSQLAPRGFLLVAKNRARFETLFGTGLPVVAEYPGRLNNGGETLRLQRPGDTSQPWTTVAEVTYSNRLPWPSRAAGAGGSLQALDANRDTRRPANWIATDADGHGYAAWKFASVTARANSSQLLVSLGNAGEVHLDDVSLVAGTVPRVGPELLANGGFEEPLSPHWITGTAVTGSFIDPSVRRSGRSSLRLVASTQATTTEASLRQIIAPSLTAGSTYTLSFWYLAHPQGGDITIRLDGGGLLLSVNGLETAVAPASPGEFSSVRDTLTPFAELWINEVRPAGFGVDTSGWVELHNAGSTAIHLAGWFLSPDPSDLGRWSFPAGTTIGPGAFLVVGLGGPAGDRSDLHTTFEMPPGSGSIVLSRTGNGVPTPIDYLHFDHLAPGRSIGSYPDGAWSDRKVFENPTPGAPNDPTSHPVRLAINEWMSRNTQTIADPADGDYDDWFEIINLGTTDVDLTGFTLSDDLTDPAKTTIPSGFVLPPRGILLIWADGEPGQTVPGTSLHADFALSANGDTVALFAPGGTIVDAVSFGPLDRDVSGGLQPDGAIGSVVRLPQPSPGLLNFPDLAGEIRITSVAATLTQFSLTWTSAPGDQYQVQSSVAVGGVWEDAGDPVLATGASTTWTDFSSAGAKARFYRVRKRTP